MAKFGTLDAATLRANIHVPLNFAYLSIYSMAETLDIAMEFPELGWAWNYLSTDASIEQHFAFAHTGRLDAWRLSVYSCTLGAGLLRRLRAAVEIQCAFRQWRARRVAAAIRIQRQFARAYWDPARAICGRRLARNARAWGLSSQGESEGEVEGEGVPVRIGVKRPRKESSPGCRRCHACAAGETPAQWRIALMRWP
jgi:hypothetical protein